MGKRGRKVSSQERVARRDEVLGFIQALGPFSIPAKTLAEKYRVTVDQIYDDRDFWIKKVKISKVDLIGKKLFMTVEKNLAIAEELRAKGTPSDRLKAVNASNQSGEVITKIMENYGFKEKIADRHEFEGLAGNFTLVTRTPEQIKNGKEYKDTGNRAGNQRETERDPGSS